MSLSKDTVWPGNPDRPCVLALWPTHHDGQLQRALSGISPSLHHPIFLRSLHSLRPMASVRAGSFKSLYQKPFSHDHEAAPFASGESLLQHQDLHYECPCLSELAINR
jgi:hypothetical protein